MFTFKKILGGIIFTGNTNKNTGVMLKMSQRLVYKIMNQNGWIKCNGRTVMNKKNVHLKILGRIIFIVVTGVLKMS